MPALRPRTLFALLIPLACAAVFIRLGFWQLERHRERAATNIGLHERRADQAIPFDSLPPDTAARSWRRVSLAGRFRYDLEQVHAGRTNDGSPGVHLLTPLERDGSDSLVIVLRGWVYSPDAASVDLARWREGGRVDLTGYALPLPARGTAAPADESTPLRSVNRTAIESRVNAPVAGAYVVMTSDSAARADSVPRRLARPTVDGGPHRSYAIQWFGFAIVALVGGLALFRRSIVADRAVG